jgi:hypothetical protein
MGMSMSDLWSTFSVQPFLVASHSHSFDNVLQHPKDEASHIPVSDSKFHSHSTVMIPA